MQFFLSSISCRTHGGPATTVQWTLNGVSVQEDSDHETSQIILDTSLNSVYDNRLRVRGKRYGTYNCSVSNNIQHFVNVSASDANVNGSLETPGKQIPLPYHCLQFFPHSYRRAHQCHCSHPSVQQYTCQYHCVLEISR